MIKSAKITHDPFTMEFLLNGTEFEAFLCIRSIKGFTRNEKIFSDSFLSSIASNNSTMACEHDLCMLIELSLKNQILNNYSRYN